VRISRNEFERRAWLESGTDRLFLSEGMVGVEALGSSVAARAMMARDSNSSREDSPWSRVHRSTTLREARAIAHVTQMRQALI
jgi:hypothetical protein